jgi:hypothetical protein
MGKKLVRWVLPVIVSVAVTGTAFVALGVWRRSADTTWCEQATAGDPVAPRVLEQQRSACRWERRRQRIMFGAIWRSGGETTADCVAELARLQLVGDQDPKAAAAIVGRYGIDPSTFDASDRGDQTRFITACSRKG